MVLAFPAGKLAYLAIKQVSKPVAKAVASGAKRSDFFKNYVCIPPARSKFVTIKIFFFFIMGVYMNERSMVICRSWVDELFLMKLHSTVTM